MYTKLTKDQIAELKQKHGDIFQITVNGKVCYLRKPNRHDLALASTVGAKTPIKFNESIINSCFVGGDAEFKTDDDLFLAASGKLDQIIQIADAEVKKL